MNVLNVYEILTFPNYEMTVIALQWVFKFQLYYNSGIRNAYKRVEEELLLRGSIKVVQPMNEQFLILLPLVVVRKAIVILFEKNSIFGLQRCRISTMISLNM